jgi:hypothetical protein
MNDSLKCPTPEDCVRVDDNTWSRHVSDFRARAREQMRVALRAGQEATAEHWRLFGHIVQLDPRDWDGYGFLDRWGGTYEGEPGDCSSGCMYYRPLAGQLAADWGVCTNPVSHRCGKLTFEHQGCPAFEPDDGDDSRSDIDRTGGATLGQS